MGPRTEPRGTPILIGKKLDLELFVILSLFLYEIFRNYFCIHIS